MRFAAGLIRFFFVLLVVLFTVFVVLVGVLFVFTVALVCLRRLHFK